MDNQDLAQLVEIARSDDNVMRQLREDPRSVIEDFDQIHSDVVSAISGLSSDTARGELMTSVSRNHCPSTSCGLSSM